MAKDLNISRLCDVYGLLLTDHMRDIVISYYDYDLSLAEIAENKSITRQAVLGVLKQAENKLKEYESVVGAVEKSDRLIKRLIAVKTSLDSNPENAKTMLNEMISELS